MLIIFLKALLNMLQYCFYFLFFLLLLFFLCVCVTSHVGIVAP